MMDEEIKMDEKCWVCGRTPSDVAEAKKMGYSIPQQEHYVDGFSVPICSVCITLIKMFAEMIVDSSRFAIIR